ncbi:MAG: glucosyltransferase domain-containing protein [Flavobacterium sp.]
MIAAESKISFEPFRLFFFSIITSFIGYGFTLTNYSLSVDNETTIGSTYVLSLGRWGTTLVRYYIFHGHLPYFTVLLGLILMSVTAVILAKLFKIDGIMSYIFCALFLTFPQLSYQLVFTMQADVVPLGFLCSALSVKYFLDGLENLFSKKSIMLLLASALLLMFVIALYQALFIIPIVIYLIILFQRTFNTDYTFKAEFKNGLYFGALLIVGVILYYLSTKLFCPPAGDAGYLSSYTSGDLSSQLPNNLSVWLKNLVGHWYYGAQTFIIVTILTIVLAVKFAIAKKHFLIRGTILALFLILPFTFTFLITNNYHPPRIYVTSGIVFAFIIVHCISSINYKNLTLVLCSLICVANIYFITKLFYSTYQIANHDKIFAEKIDAAIRDKYPDFNESVDYVYFYGFLPFEHHQQFRLKNSEIFGGSLFSWDNGDNFRIVNLFRFHDIANYKYLDNQQVYLGVKDSISAMPVWPNKESIKKVNNVVIVKIGDQEGAPLRFEH